MLFLGQRVKNFLERFFKPGAMPVQSLLFYGEEFLGKKTAALAFAKALMCETVQKQWESCGQCASCLRFDKGLHPDFWLIEPHHNEKQSGSGPKDIVAQLGQKNDIPIETARQAIEFLNYKPQFSSQRILIINDADRLKEDAQNTLLKTLEEPPVDSLIILITAFPQKLLATILSRMLTLRFSRSSSQEIAEFLAKQQLLNPAEAQKISQQANGKIGLALKLLDKKYRQDIENSQKELTIILASDLLERFKYLRQLSDDKIRLRSVLKIWLEMLSQDIQTETRENKSNLKLSLAAKVKLAKELLKAFHLVSTYNINHVLLLENIFLNSYGN